MSRWIRGRLGRPLASIVSIVMLVTFLLPLAPLRLNAQGEEETSGSFESLLESGMKTVPVPLVVIDFKNNSNYKTGMLGRDMADALALSFTETGKYTVVPRSDMESAMQDMNLSTDMDYTAQARLASRLNSPFTVSGTIDDVQVRHDATGTYAIVQISTYVVSKITRLPINGARVTQKSSPKLGEISNTDLLVYEALSTAAYKAAQKIIDQRLPKCTVLSVTPDGIVQLRGGTLIGLRSGMKMVAVRQESVSGILRVDQVTAASSTAMVLENNRGVAPGDRVVSIFSLETQMLSPDRKEAITMKAAALAAGILFFAVIGRSAKENNGGQITTAAPLADAAITSAYIGGIDELGMIQPFANMIYGGILIKWKDFSVKGQVVKYLVMRVTNNVEYPIAAVDKDTFFYIDPGEVPIEFVTSDPLNIAYAIEKTYDLTIDGTTGAIIDPPGDAFSTVFIQDGGTFTHTSTATATNYTLDTQVTPLSQGSVVRYKVVALYKSLVPQSGTATGPTFEFRFTENNPISKQVTMIKPPAWITPTVTDNTINGLFSTEVSPGANSYVLQISGDPSFSTATTEVIPAAINNTGNTPSVDARFTLADILASDKLSNASQIFVRMGAKSTNSTTPKAFANPSYNGYVFSTVLNFSLMRAMLTNRLMMRGEDVIPTGAMLKNGPGHGSSGQRTRQMKR